MKIRKTIIGVWGTANKGKSTTIRTLGRNLKNNGAQTENDVEKYNEYQAVFDYRGIKVGLQTYGDVASLVEEGLEELELKGSDIIVIATKSYGRTVDHLGEFAGIHDYRVLWVTPIEIYNVEEGEIHQMKYYSASQLEVMINDIIDGIL